VQRLRAAAGLDGAGIMAMKGQAHPAARREPAVRRGRRPRTPA
jgi:hypothetical protein